MSMSVSAKESLSNPLSRIRSSGRDPTSSTGSRSQRILRLLLSVGFLLITWDIILLISHRPIGYVIDMYSTLPGSFFPTLIAGFLIGSIVVIAGNSKNRKLGVLLLVCTQLAVLIIPYMLGYYLMGRSDDMTYIGEYVHIAKSGQVAGWDIYPASLIFGGIGIIISGMQANQVAYIVPIVFSFIFTAGLFLFCRIFTTNRFYLDIACISSFVLYLGSFNFANTPNALFFAFVPIFIYAIFRYLKARTVPNAVIMLLMTIIMPFSHPFIFYFVFSFQLVLMLMNPLFRKLGDVDFRILLQPVIIMTCVFLTWFITCEALLYEFRRSYFAYLERASSTVLNETVGKLSIVDFDILDIVKLLLVYYGRYMLPLLIVAMVLIYVFLKRDRIPMEMKRNLKFLTLLFLITLVFEGVLVINPLITHTPDRISNLNFIVFAQVPLFAYSILIMFPRSRSSRRAVAGIALVLLIIATAWGLSLYGTFNSPNTFEPSAALAYNEVESMRWFYDVKSDLVTVDPSSQIFRYHDLFDDGIEEEFITIPDHFGYNSTLNFADTILEKGEQMYVAIPTVDEQLYQEVPGYLTVGRYVADDFIRFRYDPSVDKVFDGLDNEMYYAFR